jgi:hypothetical protein
MFETLVPDVLAHFAEILIYTCIFVFSVCVIILQILDYNAQTERMHAIATDTASLRDDIRDLRKKIDRRDVNIYDLKTNIQWLIAAVEDLKTLAKPPHTPDAWR